MNEVIDIKDEVSALMKEGHLLEAIKQMKGQLPIVREDWELSWNLGWCYFSLDRFEESRKHLIRADKLAPNNVICKWALGAAYLKLKQYKKAELNLSESLSIKDSYSARIALAMVYMKQRRLNEAENIHLEGIKLRPTELEDTRHMQISCLMSDERKKRSKSIERLKS